MIIDSLFFVLQSIVNILLSPLIPLDWAVSAAFNISIVADFINIVAFVLPWSNILPIFVFIIAMFGFRIIIALIKVIWDLLPIL